MVCASVGCFWLVSRSGHWLVDPLVCGSIGPLVAGWSIHLSVCRSLDKLLIHRLVLVSQCTLVNLLVCPWMVHPPVVSLVGWSVGPSTRYLVCCFIGQFLGQCTVPWLASLFCWSLGGPLLIVVWSISLHVGQVCSSIRQVIIYL